MLSKFLEWWDEHWCNIAARWCDIAEIVLTAIVIAMIAVALGGAIENEANAIDAGIIIDKHMNIGATRCVTDKNGIHQHVRPMLYSFTIRGEKNEKTVEYTFKVTAEEYDAYKIGEEYRR